MKIALISDTHGMLPLIPDEAEAIIHAGDVCSDIYKGGRYQAAWLREVFAPWATQVKVPIYLTWGNHDFVGERVPEAALDAVPANVDIVVDQTRIIADKKMWFSPWSNLCGGWAWMKPEDGLAERYALIPADTQIIVSHGPPKGYGDSILWDGVCQNVGSQSLLAACRGLPDLELVVTGHIHEARGTYEVETKLNDYSSKFTVMNVSCVDFAYNPVPDGPVLIDI